MSLRFSDSLLEKKFGNIFDHKDILIFRILYLFVLMGSVLILFLEIFEVSEAQFRTHNYIQLITVLIYLMFGFVIFSKSFNKRTGIYLILVYLLFIGLRVLYEWLTETFSKVMSVLVLASFINMLLGPVIIALLSLLVDILSFVRLFL